jgi:hypothetical protein
MWPPLAGLAVALLVDWLFCPAPRAPTLSGWGLFLNAIPYVLLTAMGGAAGAAVFVRQSRKSKQRDLIVTRVAAAVVWCAPLVVLVASRSVWAMVPLVVLVAKLIPRFPIRTASAAPVAGSDIFDLPDMRLLRQLPSSLWAAVCLQAAAVAGLAGYPEVAGPMLAMTAGVLSWHAARSRAPQQTGSGRPMLGIALAAVVTILAMMPYLRMGGGFGEFVHGQQNGAGNMEAKSPSSEAATRFEMQESYRGVILWPPVQRHVTLVPPLPAMGHDPFRTNRNPLDLPFYGAYWFFRPPYTRPPPGSVEMRGNPTDLTFRSQSARPMLMEAHQNLGKLIDLNCCARIEIAIVNRDRYSGVVSIELTVANTSLPEKPVQSLGAAPVTSHPGFAPAAGTTAALELLRFPIPQERFISQFDELVVRFQRLAVRSHQSANISIERFVLVPVGR